LDGNERVDLVEAHWLKNIASCSKKRLSWTKTFPFIKIVVEKYTDVTMNAGSDVFPKIKHIYALESPALMAKKFGIVYPDVASELVKDGLWNG